MAHPLECKIIPRSICTDAVDCKKRNHPDTLCDQPPFKGDRQTIFGILDELDGNRNYKIVEFLTESYRSSEVEGRFDAHEIATVLRRYWCACRKIREAATKQIGLIVE